MTAEAPDRALATALRGWMPAQRWFQGKARELADVEVVDEAELTADGIALRTLVVEAIYDEGPAERYLVPLVADDEGPLAVGSQRLSDGLAHPEVVRALAAAATSETTVPTRDGGRLRGRPVTGQAPPARAAVRGLGVEQTNSSAVLDDAWILKVLRRLEPGAHPDVELTAALTSAGFAHVPAQHGSLVLDRADGAETALAVLSDFHAGAEEGWALATAATTAMSQGRGGEAHDLHDDLERLGGVVAALHTTLAATLGRGQAGAGEAAAWARGMRAQAERVLDLADRRGGPATAPVVAEADAIAAAFDEVAALADAGPLTRIHGDLHLGQVLRTPEGSWQLLDFEGEPSRPLAQRRAADSPLRDVAGMVRSFDYAAAAPTGGAAPDPAVGAWRDEARRRFLDGYAAGAGDLLPAAETTAVLLAALELDKAIYELGYELSNRPGWAPIPAGGILRVLDARGDHS